MKIYENVLRLLGKDHPREALSVRGTGDNRRAQALRSSYELYSGKGDCGVSVGLASGIVSELSRLTLTELSLTYGDRKCDLALMDAMSGFKKRIRPWVEYSCATGGIMLKPCYDGHALTVQALLPFDFIPLGTDGSGCIDSCAFIYRANVGERKYFRIEEHRWEGDTYVITNKAYASDGSASPCPLSAVPRWSGLSPRCKIDGLSSPLFAYFGIPGSDPDDPDSPLGIPVFRRAEGLIREADRQLERLIWEFEGGELAIDASEDAFRVGKDGNPRLPEGKERLYRTNALDACCSTNELMKVFSPELRDRSIINGLNRIVMLVEDTCGIARGTFSDPSEVAKTATEVRASRQRTYSTVRAIQTALENAVDDLVTAMNETAALYGLWEGNATLRIGMGDGVLNDSESVKQSQREDVKHGILTPEEFKSRWYGNKQGGTYEKRIS